MTPQAPNDAPTTCIQQARFYGAEVKLIPGRINDAGHILAQDIQGREGWFNFCDPKRTISRRGGNDYGIGVSETAGLATP